MAETGAEMIRWAFAVVIIGLFSISDPAHAFQEKSALETEASDSVEAGFILRSQDLFWQTGYHPVSLDRMSFMLDSHIYGRYGPSPDFYADGIPFDPTYFGMTFTQLLPLPIHHLKETMRTSKRGSGVAEGKPYEAGIMEFFSEPLKKGFSVSAVGQVGHNSGEPGPWAFDPERVSPNVERFGPWIEGTASVRLGSWYAKGLLKTHSYIHVDEFLQNRLINLRIQPETGEVLRPDASTTLGLAESGILKENLTVRLQALTSESEDFLFFQPAAREVPTAMESAQFSGLLHVKLNHRIGLRSLVQLRERELGYRLHRFSHNFDWKRESKLFRSSVYFGSEKTTLELGAEWEDNRLDADGLTDYHSTYRTGFVQLKQSITEKLTLKGDSRVVLGDENRAASGSAGVYLDITKSWQMGLRGQYDELLPEQARPLDQWVLNGWSIFNQLGIDGLYLSDGKKSSSRELGMIQQIGISDKLSVDTEITWIENLSLPIPFQYAAYNFPFSTEPGTYLLQQNAGGQRFTGNLRLEYRSSSRLQQTAALYMNRVENGDRLYNLYWQSTPELSVQYSLKYKPYRDTEIHLNAQYISERQWPEFERIDGESNRTFYVQYPFRFFTFENDLPAHLNIDLSFSKWFWNQRFRGVILLKNVLNRNYQTHPLGIREGFGYLLRVEMRL